MQTQVNPSIVPQNYALLRNARVEIEPREIQRARSTKIVADITIDGRYKHTFNEDSRVSKSLGTMPIADLTAMMSGGSYFIVNNRLIDFRYSNYDGFVHTDDAIDALANTLGFMDPKALGKAARAFKANTMSGAVLLGKMWSDCPIVVPGYKSGGDFSSQLMFRWNPFVKCVDSFFQLLRMICTNGAIGIADFLNTKIPLVNRWEEHLEIANRQIQNKVEGISLRRFQQMRTERASVDEASQIYAHAQKRIKVARKEGDDEQAGSLERIASIVNPVRHLGHVYNESVFGDKRMAAQYAAHLTTFDVYNLATEIRTHTDECPESTDFALDRIANHILFDRKGLIGFGDRQMAPTLSQFSDPDQAFFGVVH